MADQPKKKPASNKNTNDERPNGKSFKQKRENMGTRQEYRGSHTSRTPISELQKALLGGGVMRNAHKWVNPAWTDPWVGAVKVLNPFDPVQARENERLYPSLFGR